MKMSKHFFLFLLESENMAAKAFDTTLLFKLKFASVVNILHNGMHLHLKTMKKEYIQKDKCACTLELCHMVGMVVKYMIYRWLRSYVQVSM